MMFHMMLRSGQRAASGESAIEQDEQGEQEPKDETNRNQKSLYMSEATERTWCLYQWTFPEGVLRQKQPSEATGQKSALFMDYVLAAEKAIVARS
mmetsp:Transcript_26662/g.54325  ORF Transcript_26662/g.54325 Transcript_26662/m.54325 type:complete len:95 (+) Transcript_26662:308-592(+)